MLFIACGTSNKGVHPFTDYEIFWQSLIHTITAIVTLQHFFKNFS